MKKFDVHAFAIVRIKVTGIEAETPSEATAKADEKLDYYDLLERGAPHEVEFAEEMSHYLVDCRRDGEEFDPEIDDSQWFGADGKTGQPEGYPEVAVKLINGELWQVYVPAGVQVGVWNLRDKSPDGSINDDTKLADGAYTFNNGALVP